MVIRNDYGVLSPRAPNVQWAVPRHRATAIKPASVAPSPLTKKSDYEVVAPLSAKSKNTARPAVSSRPPPAAPSSTANLPNQRKLEHDPVKPKPAFKKERKKLLCATPPAVLQDSRGKAEYDRGRQLGEGGFARCFMVQNRMGELFAAKTVAKKSLSTHKMKTKFFGEIHVHKTMDHPNVVKFNECFEDEDNIYMILELCPNKSMMDMLRARKRFTEPETRFFLLQLLGALKYMHGKRVIHRDLKLGNIFLDEHMNIKIGDFGLAALLVSEDERKRTICGTPNYIAPEILFEGGKNGEGHSFEVDLWSFGVIMYAMLVGKPPFQSSDVDSIYKKIRENSFVWPETVSVSLAAKSLVNSLLNRDPSARPSLDEIASHPFFRSGFFPRAIPTSALKHEPYWPPIGTTSATLVATRQEWRRNYDEVARLSGVGFDSKGNPFTTGAQPGKSIALSSVPAARPSSASSSTSGQKENSIQKILEKRRLVENKRTAAKPAEKKAYVLPEVLSPRDGHARMRNVNMLRSTLQNNLTTSTNGKGLFPKKEQSLPPKQELPAHSIPEEVEDQGKKIEDDAPAQPKPRQLRKQPIRRSVPDNAEDEGKKTEDDEPVRPEPRQLRKQPIRRSTVEAAAAKQTVFPATRRMTRSHAAEQRAASIAEPVSLAEPAPGKPSSKVMQAPEKRARPMEPKEESKPEPMPKSRPNSFAETLAPEKSDLKRASAMVIPYEPCYTSKIGVPMPITNTATVLESLKPFIRNLQAFTSGSLSDLPRKPQSTIDAVKAYRRGEDNKFLFITKWVDYTNKYGVAYILTDGTCAALYNDNTSLIVNSVGGSHVEFITQSYTQEEEERPATNSDVVFRRLSTTMSVIDQKKRTSKGLANKVLMWKRFGKYMKENLGSEEDWNCKADEAVRESSIPSQEAEAGMLFVTHYARLKRCAIFRFFDGGFQFNFSDHTKLVLSSGGRTLRLINKQYGLVTMSLDDAFGYCYPSTTHPMVREFGLKAKLNYIKEILKLWLRRGRFPLDIDGPIHEDEKKKPIVLGEGPP